MEREGGVVFPQLIYLNKAMRRQEDEDADKDENENGDEDGVAVQKFRRRRRTSHVATIPLPSSRNTPTPLHPPPLLLLYHEYKGHQRVMIYTCLHETCGICRGA